MYLIHTFSSPTSRQVFSLSLSLDGGLSAAIGKGGGERWAGDRGDAASPREDGVSRSSLAA